MRSRIKWTRPVLMEDDRDEDHVLMDADTLPAPVGRAPHRELFSLAGVLSGFFFILSVFFDFRFDQESHGIRNDHACSGRRAGDPEILPESLSSFVSKMVLCLFDRLID